jgi:hypothetical protein
MRHMLSTLVVGVTFLGPIPREVSLLAPRPDYRVTQDDGSAPLDRVKAELWMKERTPSS